MFGPFDLTTAKDIINDIDAMLGIVSDISRSTEDNNTTIIDEIEERVYSSKKITRDPRYDLFDNK